MYHATKERENLLESLLYEVRRCAHNCPPDVLLALRDIERQEEIDRKRFGSPVIPTETTGEAS